MSHIKVFARFRPLSSSEISDHGDTVCIQRIDSETFNFKDEKEESLEFSFDKVFYDNSEQADVYGCIALPIVQDAFCAINGTIIAYGQTGAGKTYSMEGPSILEFEDSKKGLLPRVVDGIFECLKISQETTQYSIKLSMVEIYMDRVRDLFDLEKDNLQIKENKVQGIFLQGATEISILDPAHALKNLARGIAYRAVGETQMNITSSRSHCIYIFTVQQESNQDQKMKAGKIVLVDLAGSEKAEKTGAEGKVLEEAKAINKSLSALGNVINSLTCGSPGKTNHIPYRDSKITRILQDALGGNSRTALLCCCSPSFSNALETLSTLRFGARASHVKTSPRLKCVEDNSAKIHVTPSVYNEELHERILSKLQDRLSEEDVTLLEYLLVLNGIIPGPDPLEEVESVYEVPARRKANSALVHEIKEVRAENKALRDMIEADKICPDFPFWFFCCFCSLLVLVLLAME